MIYINMCIVYICPQDMHYRYVICIIMTDILEIILLFFVSVGRTKCIIDEAR